MNVDELIDDLNGFIQNEINKLDTRRLKNSDTAFARYLGRLETLALVKDKLKEYGKDSNDT